MTVKTQGTEVFFVSAAALIRLAAPTGVSGLGGAADQIEITDLDDTVDKQYARGLGNPGQVTIPFNMVPSETSQQALFTLKDSGATTDWIVCLSDGIADPTYTAGIVPPASRTSFEFTAYISDVTIDMATNEIVRGTLTLQRSGVVTPTWKS